jgi:hypothetical protein
MQRTQVRRVQGIHWDGDEIVSNPVIPAQRTIPVVGKALYDIDVRQFLTIEGNAVLRGAVERIGSPNRAPDSPRPLSCRKPEEPGEGVE